MMYCNHGPKTDFFKWKLQNLASRESCFRRSNHRHERNNTLTWETYNLLLDWKETILEPSKLRFKRSRSDLSVKTCSNHQLKIAVLNRSERRFRAWNDVFSAKVKELSAMMYCNHGPKRDFFKWKLQNLACRESCFRAQTIEMSEMTCWNVKPITWL